MKTREITMHFEEYESIVELSTQDQELVQFALETANFAYAPYSNFKVGAAIRLENNVITTGNNQENAAYPSGLCAERVAMFYANSKFPTVAVKDLAIFVSYNGQPSAVPIPPCGSCRQVLMETETRFKSPVRIILASSGKVQVIRTAKDLLPLNFDSDFFAKTILL